MSSKLHAKSSFRGFEGSLHVLWVRLGHSRMPFLSVSDTYCQPRQFAGRYLDATFVPAPGPPTVVPLMVTEL